MDDDLRIPPIRPSLEARTKRKDRGKPDGGAADLTIDHDRKRKAPPEEQRGGGKRSRHDSADSVDETAEGGIIDILA